MSVKIKIFYENDRELEEIKKSLQNKIEQCKIPKNQTGKFKKAYIKINATSIIERTETKFN